MKFFSSKKLFFVLCTVVIVVSIPLLAQIKIKKTEDKLIITTEKRKFIDPAAMKEIEKITLSAPQFHKDMSFSAAKKQLNAFDEQIFILGENLSSIKKTSKKEKNEIIDFLIAQLPGLIDLRVSLEPKIKLGRKIMRKDFYKILMQITNQTKKLKALIAAKTFIKKIYPQTKELVDQAESTGQMASGLIDDLEKMIQASS